VTNQVVPTGQTKVYRSVHGDGGYLIRRGPEVSAEDFAKECEQVCRDYERETGRTAVMSGADGWIEVDTGQR
jgi:hypothetical protein